MFDTDHYVTLVFHDSVDSGSSKSACQNTVVGSRATSALQVSQNRYTYVVLRVFVLYTFGIVHRSSGQFAFRH